MSSTATSWNGWHSQSTGPVYPTAIDTNTYIQDQPYSPESTVYSSPESSAVYSSPQPFPPSPYQQTTAYTPCYTPSYQSFSHPPTPQVSNPSQSFSHPSTPHLSTHHQSFNSSATYSPRTMGTSPSYYPSFPHHPHTLTPSMDMGPYNPYDTALSSCVSRSSSFSVPRSISCAVPNINSKTVTANKVLNSDHAVSFNTAIDSLVKVINQNESTALQSAVSQPVEQEYTPMRQSFAPSIMNMTSDNTSVSAPRVIKRHGRTMYQCTVEGCGKAFGQRSHVEIHHRAHTGERPYTCSFPDCGRGFSQMGNLRTHERIHIGHRPHICVQCSRGFGARSKLRAHLVVHTGERNFICKLDDCNKSFTQLGNLKAHQNKFHKQTILDLIHKAATLTSEQRDALSHEESELLVYFAMLYKNSNKGIKGRGKGRKVAVIGAGPSNPVPPPGFVAVSRDVVKREIQRPLPPFPQAIGQPGF